jgi:tRNA(fMet)-specific endonuclease VapC
VKYVLDTNAASALMRGDSRVVDRLAQTSRDAVGIPQPVLAEIAYGIERLPRSRRRENLHRRLELLRAELKRCEWSDAVSETFAEIKAALEKKGERIEDFDVAIAAHAVVHDAILVTANTKHMRRVRGLTIEDWSV